jgi:hypothetical protein
MTGTRSFLLLVLSILASFSAATAGGGDWPAILYEESGATRTPRYDATIAWCRQMAAASDIIHYDTFGISPQGRPLPVLVVDLQGRFQAEDHQERGDRTVLLVEACIHAGESCGKDAGMVLLRDLAADREQARRLLGNTTLVFIPIFNVDGHERFSPYSRINQNGPEEMGWRVTANNLNLNRDFLKADTPEMQSWLGLFNRWDPDFFVDIHSTDGADYQYVLTYGLELRGNMEAGLTDWTRNYLGGMEEAMAAEGFPIGAYVSFVNWHDPQSGLRSGVMGPRFSQGYAAVRNRPGLLIEAHMLKPYEQRVESTRLMLVHTLHWLAAEGKSLRQAVRRADRITASPEFRSEPFALTFKRSEESRKVEFLGVEYEKRTSEITGGDWFQYHSDRPVTMILDHQDTMLPEETVQLPAAYIVPREWQGVIAKLELHGVKTWRLPAPAELEVRSYRLVDAEWRQRPYEGRHRVSFTAEPVTETRMFPAGSVVVDMNQPLARVAAHLLEPKGPDSLVSWGYLDAVFERVEYVESYVIEEMIREMVAEDPGLLDRLDERKAADPEFAANPWAIRYWFYEQTPYYDQRVGLYPVGLLDDAESLSQLKR